MKIGDVIQIKPEHLPVIEQLREREREAHGAFCTASRLMMVANDRLWEMIREAYPELNNCRLTLDAEGKELLVLGTKEELADVLKHRPAEATK